MDVACIYISHKCTGCICDQLARKINGLYAVQGYRVNCEFVNLVSIVNLVS